MIEPTPSLFCSHCNPFSFAALAGGAVDALAVRTPPLIFVWLLSVLNACAQVPNNESLTDWGGYGAAGIDVDARPRVHTLHYSNYRIIISFITRSANQAERF